MKKLLFFLGIILICIFVGVYFLSRWTTNQPQEAAVIQQIRTLNRWETASYTVQQIIDNGSTGNVFQRFLFGDRILLVAQGTVTAGFDLSNLSKNNIHISGKSITIQMPSPEILSTSLNESQTRVYDRQKGLLVPENNNLESEARILAVSKIHQAACSEGVLDTASDNAKKQLTTMLQTIGFTTIMVTIPRGHC
jgi:hypothetical protein